MPRVHYVKAAKDYPSHDIKKGDMYYHWTFKNQWGPGTKVKSKTRPRPSQLTRSEFLSAYYSIQENIDDCKIDKTDDPQEMVDALEAFRDEIVGEIESLRDEQEEKKSNMPDSLQEGPTGELLQERYDGLDGWADELNNIDFPDVSTFKKEAGEDDSEAGDFDWDEFQSALDDCLSEFSSGDPGL